MAEAIRNGHTIDALPLSDYRVFDDGTVEIIKHYSAGRKISIPKEINGMSVTSIGESAFSERIYLTEVELPDGMLSIEKSAFSYCISLMVSA